MERLDIDAPGETIYALAVSRDGTKLGLVLTRGAIRVLDADGTERGRTEPREADWVTHLAFLDDGRLAAATGNVVRILDARGPSLSIVEVTGKFDASRSPVTALAAVGPDLVTGHADGAIRRITLAVPRFERSVYKADHKSPVRAVVPGTDDGTFLTTGGALVASWHLDRTKPEATFSVPRFYVHTVDAARRIALGADGRGALATVELGKDRLLPLGVVDTTPKVGFLDDGSIALVDRARVRVLDATLGTPIRAHEPGSGVVAIARSGTGDDEILWVATARSVVRFSGRTALASRRREIRARHAGLVHQLLPTPDGWLSVSTDGSAKRWAADGHFLGTLRVPGTTIRCATKAADGLVVGTASSEAVVLSLDGRLGARTKIAEWHLAGVATADDGSWVAGTDLRGELAVLPTGGKRARARTNLEGRAGGTLVWSAPAGLFVACGEGATVLDVDLEVRARIACRGRVVLSPDRLRFAVPVPSGVEIRSLASPEAVARLLVLTDAGPLAWTDGGVWAAADREMVQFDPDTGARITARTLAVPATAVLGIGDAVVVGDANGDVVRLARAPAT